MYKLYKLKLPIDLFKNIYSSNSKLNIEQNSKLVITDLLHHKQLNRQKT